MNQTVKTIMNAFSALTVMDINGCIPYRTMRDLHKLKQVLLDETQTAERTLREMIPKYNGELSSGGLISFPDVDSRAAYKTARDEVLQTPIDLPIEPIDLSSFADAITFRNVNADIDSLSAFIIFEKGEENG